MIALKHLPKTKSLEVGIVLFVEQVDFYFQDPFPIDIFSSTVT